MSESCVLSNVNESGRIDLSTCSVLMERTLGLQLLRTLGIVAAAAAFAATVLGQSVMQEQDAVGVVVTSTRVSPNPSNSAYWWTIQASTRDPQRVIICAQQTNPSKGLGLEGVLYGSADAGETWHTLFEAGIVTSEVHCAFGGDGTIYYIDSVISNHGAALSHDELVKEERSRLWRSSDFGKSWEQALTGTYEDSAFLVTDPDSASERNRVLVFGHGGDGLNRTVIVADHGGKTLVKGETPLPSLSGPRIERIEGSATYTATLVGCPEAIALADGSYGAVYTDPFGPDPKDRVLQQITFSRVTADGAGVGQPTVIAALSRGKGLTRELDEAWRDNRVTASIATGTSSEGKRRLFVAWSDLVEGRLHIVLSTSEDEGRTWTEKRVLDDLPMEGSSDRGNMAQDPSVVVSPSGVVGAVWSEQRGRCWRFASSRDFGEHFSKSAPLNDCSVPAPRYEQKLSSYTEQESAATPTASGVRFRIGDGRLFHHGPRLISLTVDQDSVFHAVWAAWGSDDDSVYSSRIEIKDLPPHKQIEIRERLRSVLANSPTLQRLDGAEKALIEVTRADYNEATRELVVGAVVVQRRSTNPSWPVAVRLHDLKSAVGEISVLGADNAEAGAGAAWVFDGPQPVSPVESSFVSQAVAENNKAFVVSSPRTLHFRLLTPPPDHMGNARPLTIDAEILGLPNKVNLE
jgi:hypothetical protein